MNVADMPGDISRLDAAKASIVKQMERYEGAYFSLSVFAGESMRILPFTQDYGLFLTFLQDMDYRSV